jgi:integrase
MRALHHPPVLFLQLALPILSEILSLTWSEVQGRKLKLTNSKTGPRIVWLGPEARAVLAEFPRGKKRMSACSSSICSPFRRSMDSGAS